MKTKLKIIISSILLLAFAGALLFTTEPPPAQASAPTNAIAAIEAAMAIDSGMSELKLKEEFEFDKLRGSRTHPEVALSANMATAGFLSDLHEIWVQMEARTGQVVTDVLSTVIAIDTEQSKLDDINALLEDMEGWLEIAEAEFRVARIERGTLENLRDMQTQLERDIEAGELRLQTNKSRFRELTGVNIADDFDFESAWLLVDIASVELEKFPDNRPVMPFLRISSLISPFKDTTSIDKLVNDAKLALISVHETVANYEKMDLLVLEQEESVSKDELSKYVLYDTIHARMLTGFTVFDSKYGYSIMILEIDKRSSGLLSSQYRRERVQWYSEPKGLFDGRLNAEYPWMSFSGGEWYLELPTEGAGRMNMKINSLWFDRGNPVSVVLSYEGRRLAEGGTGDVVTFDAPSYTGSSLIKAAFFNEEGIELYHAYLDGFANAGRFFWVNRDINGNPLIPVLGTPHIRNEGDFSLNWGTVENIGYLQEYRIEYRYREFDLFSGIPGAFLGDFTEYEQISTTSGGSFNLADFMSGKVPGEYEFRVTARSFNTERCLHSDPSNTIRITVHAPPGP